MKSKTFSLIVGILIPMIGLAQHPENQDLMLNNDKGILWKDSNGTWRGQISTSGNLFKVTPMGSGQPLIFGDGTSSPSDTWFGGISGTGAPSNVPLIIKSSGLIGIGTSTPSYKLDVNGQMRIGGISGITALTNADDLIVESSSSGGLSILTPNNYNANFYFGNTSDNAAAGMRWDYTNKVYTIGTLGSGTIKLLTGNFTADRGIIIDPTGKVGIGIIDPSSKLDVDGQVRLSYNASTGTGGSLNIDNPSGEIPAISMDQGAQRWWQYVDEDNTFRIGRGSNYNSNEPTIALLSDKVGIGTTDFSSGNHKLRVEGSIGAREIKVEASGWSDFVFEKDYELRTLEEVEKLINDNGHLPEIPSEVEVAQNGINLGEMNAKLLQKIEELTLYLIDHNKQLQNANQNIAELRKEVSALKNE